MLSCTLRNVEVVERRWEETVMHQTRCNGGNRKKSIMQCSTGKKYNLENFEVLNHLATIYYVLLIHQFHTDNFLQPSPTFTKTWHLSNIHDIQRIRFYLDLHSPGSNREKHLIVNRPCPCMTIDTLVWKLLNLSCNSNQLGTWDQCAASFWDRLSWQTKWTL